MTLLYDQFTKIYKTNINLYTIHDCFASTADKINYLLIALRSVYTKLYTTEPYLRKFDKGIIATINANYGDIINTKDRSIMYENKKYVLHSLDWVLGNEVVDNKTVKKINSQYILN